MRVEVPNDPADAGAGCCAVLTPSCISPEIPSLPDLLNSAVDVGDDRDEEQFQQNLHDLPSPAGAAFALKLAAVQGGCFALAGPQPAATAGPAAPASDNSIAQQAPHASDGTYSSHQCVHDCTPQQQQGSAQAAQLGLTYSPLCPPAAAQQQQQQQSSATYNDSLLNSAQLELDQLIGPAAPDDLSDQLDAVLCADWLNCPSSGNTALSASPMAPTGISRNGTAGLASCRSGSTSLGMRPAGNISTPPHLPPGSRLRPGLRVGTGGSSRSSAGPAGLVFGPTAAEGARADAAGSGCGSNSSLQGSGCLSASAAGQLSGVQLQQTLWGAPQQDSSWPSCTLPPAPALRLHPLDSTAAAAAAAAEAEAFAVPAPGFGTSSGNDVALPLGVLSAGMLPAVQLTQSGPLHRHMTQMPSLGSNTGGMYPSGTGAILPGQRGPTAGGMGPLFNLEAGMLPAGCSCPPGPNWMPTDMAAAAAGFSVAPPAGTAAAAAAAGGAGPRGYVQMLMGDEDRNTEAGAEPAGAAAAAAAAPEDLLETVTLPNGQCVQVVKRQAAKSKGRGKRLPSIPYNGPIRPAARCLSFDHTAAAAASAAPANVMAGAAGTGLAVPAAVAAAQAAAAAGRVDLIPLLTLPPDPVVFVNLPFTKRSGQAKHRGDEPTQEHSTAGAAAAAAAADGSDDNAGSDAGAAAAAAGAEGGSSGGAAAPKRRGAPKYQTPCAPPVSDAKTKAQARAAAQVIFTMHQRDIKRKAALNLVHQIDKFTAAGDASGVPKPGLEAVTKLADSVKAICLSLGSELLTQSEKIDRDRRANPKSHSRKEDNFGHHAGHIGWIQCRGYGVPESEEPAAREAAFAMARLEQRMAKRYREKILACGNDTAAARKLFEEMLQELSVIRVQQDAQLARTSIEPAPCCAVHSSLQAQDPAADTQQSHAQQQQQQEPQGQAQVLLPALLPAGPLAMAPGRFVLPPPQKQQQLQFELLQQSFAMGQQQQMQQEEEAAHAAAAVVVLSRGPVAAALGGSDGFANPAAAAAASSANQGRADSTQPQLLQHQEQKQQWPASDAINGTPTDMLVDFRGTAADGDGAGSIVGCSNAGSPGAGRNHGAGSSRSSGGNSPSNRAPACLGPSGDQLAAAGSQLTPAAAAAGGAERDAAANAAIIAAAAEGAAAAAAAAFGTAGSTAADSAAVNMVNMGSDGGQGGSAALNGGLGLRDEGAQAAQNINDVMVNTTQAQLLQQLPLSAPTQQQLLQAAAAQLGLPGLNSWALSSVNMRPQHAATAGYGAVPAHMEGIGAPTYQPEPPFLPAAAAVAAAAAGAVVPPQTLGKAVTAAVSVDAAAAALAQVFLTCSTLTATSAGPADPPTAFAAEVSAAMQCGAQQAAPRSTVGAKASTPAGAGQHLPPTAGTTKPGSSSKAKGAGGARKKGAAAKKELVHALLGPHRPSKRATKGAAAAAAEIRTSCEPNEEQTEAPAAAAAAAASALPAAVTSAESQAGAGAAAVAEPPAAAMAPAAASRRSRRSKKRPRGWDDMVEIPLEQAGGGAAGADDLDEGEQEGCPAAAAAAAAASDPSTCPSEDSQDPDHFDAEDCDDDFGFSDDGFDDDDDEEARANRKYRVRSTPGSSICRWISLTDLRKRFHMTSGAAAEDLKIGLTMLKKFARSFNIERWPARKLNGVQKLIDEVRAFHTDEGGEEGAERVLRELRQVLADIVKDPNMVLSSRVSALQNAVYKLRYKKKPRGGRGRGRGATR